MEQLGDPLAQKILTADKIEEIQNRIKHITTSPPQMICVNVVLEGQAALEHLICREIIMASSDVTSEEADWYLLRSGSKKELEKMSLLAVKKDDS